MLTESQGKPTSYFPVDYKDMSEFLNRCTKWTFKNDTCKLEERALVRSNFETIPYLPTSKNKGHIVTVPVKENNKCTSREVSVGADAVNQTVYYYDKETKKRKEKECKVREIRSYQQFLDEVNWLGRKGVLRENLPDPYEYYRFGDWVISLNLKDFYVGDHFIGRIRGEKLSELKAYSCGMRKPTYDELRKVVGKLDLCMVKLWIYGKNDEVAKNDPVIEEGVLTMAMFLSESIRNFRTHVINMMAIEMSIGWRHDLTSEDFIKHHPMARGGTWPDQSKTGFDGLNNANEPLVLPLELSYIR